MLLNNQWVIEENKEKLKKISPFSFLAVPMAYGSSHGQELALPWRQAGSLTHYATEGTILQ